MKRIGAVIVISSLIMSGCSARESQVVEAPSCSIQSLSNIEVQKNELFRTDDKMYSRSQTVELLKTQLSLKEGYSFSLKAQEDSNGYWAYKFVFSETYDNVDIYGCDITVRIFADGTIVEGFLAKEDLKKADVLLSHDKLLEMYQKDNPDDKETYQYEKLCYLYRENPEAESPLCYLYIGDSITKDYLFINAVTGNMEKKVPTAISNNKQAEQ